MIQLDKTTSKRQWRERSVALGFNPYITHKILFVIFVHAQTSKKELIEDNFSASPFSANDPPRLEVRRTLQCGWM